MAIRAALSEHNLVGVCVANLDCSVCSYVRFMPSASVRRNVRQALHVCRAVVLRRVHAAVRSPVVGSKARPKTGPQRGSMSARFVDVPRRDSTRGVTPQVSQETLRAGLSWALQTSATHSFQGIFYAGNGQPQASARKRLERWRKAANFTDPPRSGSPSAPHQQLKRVDALAIRQRSSKSAAYAAR